MAPCVKSGLQSLAPHSGAALQATQPQSHSHHVISTTQATISISCEDVLRGPDYVMTLHTRGQSMKQHIEIEPDLRNQEHTAHLQIRATQRQERTASVMIR